MSPPSDSQPTPLSDQLPEAPGAGYWNRIPWAWRLGVLAYIVSRLPLLIFAWLIDHYHQPYLPPGHYLFHGGEPYGYWLVDAFQKWDSYWFLNIVRNGYQYFGIQEQIKNIVSVVPETNITLFPLYPVLMKLLAPVLGDASVAGLIISQLCCLSCLVLIYPLARMDLGERGAQMSVWFLALAPWGYTFSVIYSESLFLGTTLAAMLACRKKRYLLAGVMGALASLTRFPGLFVLLPIAWETMAERGFKLCRIDRQILSLFIVPLGTLSYFAYLWCLTDEPLAYFLAMKGWHKEFVGIWYHPLQWLLNGIGKPERVLEIGTTVAMVTVLVIGFKRVRWSSWVYAVVYFWMIMSSSNLVGLPRYCTGLFPLYLILGDLSERNSRQGWVMLILFALATPIVFWVWTSWVYAF